MDNKRILLIVVVLSLVFFGVLLLLNNSKENEEKNLIGVVEVTYEQAIKGENIPCEETWKIAELYNDGVKDLSEAEWDELDRKINVIADACKFDPSNPDSPAPFRPVTKNIRHDEPADPWVGPTD